MTFNITAFNIMTFNIKTFSIQPFSISTFSIKTFSIKPFSIKPTLTPGENGRKRESKLDRLEGNLIDEKQALKTL
jgi:hypothetical protein